MINGVGIMLLYAGDLVQNGNIYHLEGDQLKDQENRESLRVVRVNAYDSVVCAW